MIKNFLFFIAGLGTMYLIQYGLEYKNSVQHDDLTLFEKDGDCIKDMSGETPDTIVIFQTLGTKHALVNITNLTVSLILKIPPITGLLLGDENDNFYDNQKINIPKTKCAKHIGTYIYMGDDKKQHTVPVVKIKDIKSKKPK